MVRADGNFSGGGGGGVWWQLLGHPWVVVAIGGVLLVLFLSAVVTAWIVVRRLRRSPGVARGLLQLRAQALPAGPGRELAALRLSLAQAIDFTVASVTLAQSSGRPVGDLPALVRRLSGLSTELDEQLRHWEGEPDQGRLRAVVPSARERTQEVTASATRIREVLGQLEAAEGGGETEALGADVATEVAALQAGVASLSNARHDDA